MARTVLEYRARAEWPDEPVMNVKDLSTDAVSTRLCRLLLEAERTGINAAQQALMAELLERKTPLFFMKDPYGTRMDLRTFGDQSNMLAVYSDERCLQWAAKDMGRHPDAFVVVGLPPRELFKQAAARSLGVAVFAYEDPAMPRVALLPPSALTLILLGAPLRSTTGSERLRIEPENRRLQISLGGKIIVNTTRALVVHEQGAPDRHYVPREDVRAELREGTEAGNCQFKGRWHSLHVSAGGKEVPNGAFLYVAPTTECRELRGHVGFRREKMDAFEVLELPAGSSQEEPEEGKGTPDEDDEASPLVIIAGGYFENGDYARAEPLLQRALALREKALGPRHRRVGTVLEQLGVVYAERGDLLRAEPLLQRALAIVEQDPESRDDAEVGRLLSNLAQSYSQRGDWVRAEPLLQRALALLEQKLGPDDPNVASVMSNLAWLHWAQNDDARAEPLFRRVLSIRASALGPAHPSVANSLNNLAQIYTRNGDHARAEPLYLRALAILERALGPEHPNVAFVLDNLAFLYSNRGDLAAADDVNAESLHQRALAIREQMLGPLHPQVAVTLHNLAWLHVIRGDISAATQAMARALSIEDHNVGLLLTSGSDEQKRTSMDTVARTTHGAVTLHVAVAPDADEARSLALTTILRRKGRVLDAMADSFAALRRRLGVEDRGLLDELRAISAELSAAMLHPPADANPDGYHSHLELLDKRRQALEAALSKRGAGALPALPEITVERVQSALPAGSALVEVFRLEPTPRSRRTAPRYVAYVLQREGEIAWADLGEAAIIEAAVARFRHELSSPGSHPVRAAREFGDALDPDGDPRPAARELDRLIMAPLRRLLGAARDVFVSPDGALNNVPFNAFVDEEGRYLVERYTFTYLASGRDLVRLDERTTPSRQGPVVVAAPDYGKKISAPAFDDDPGAHRSAEMRGMCFGPLRFAADEGRAVARKLAGGVLLLGKDATDHAIQALQGPALLHIATHGFFLPDTPAPALPPPPDARNDLGGWASVTRRIDNPLVRAGLALAGANQGRTGSGLGLHGHEDGVLTALELAHVDLMGTQLVVLSACGTGLGECRSGDGVYGLRRAVATAGAETQVMSLWSVDDAATSELMQSYYDHLLAGGGRSEAMRQAQLAMLRRPDRAHPFYWASFIVSGNPAPLDGNSLRDGPGGEPRAERSTSLFMRLKSMLFSKGSRR